MAPTLTKSGAPSNRREKIPEGTLCVVCEDLASGIHYSVASCNGCKTFFRRALVNKQTFTCQFNGECLVGKNVRCVCRSCRLKKCFDQGMDPKAIQHDRDKIRYTKVLKRQKEEAKAREEAERERMLKVKDEIGSPGSVECCDGPSSSRATSSTRVFDSEVDLFCISGALLATGTLTDLDSTLTELMRIEKKLIEVRNAYRHDDQISTIWNMYIGSRAMLSEDDWLASATQMQPMLFSLTERVQTAQPSPYRCAKITPWSLREWFQRDLTLMMEWVKLLPGCEHLMTTDKVALQKNFALTYAVFQLTFYTQDTTVLGGFEESEGTTMEERWKNLKRAGEPLRARTPPPPIPSLTSSLHLPAGLVNLANSLYKQPLSKRIRDEILNDEPHCSEYLRRLTEAGPCSSTSTSSSFVIPPNESTSSFLSKNGLTAVSSFSESIATSNAPPLPPTMSTGLPGALSDCLGASLQASHTSAPALNHYPTYPTGFFSALCNSLANSPGSLCFPPSPILTASPLITSSPLMVQSPLMATSPMMASTMTAASPLAASATLMAQSPLMAASPLMVASPLATTSTLASLSMSGISTMTMASFMAPAPPQKEKTPEIDVETLSMDGRSEDRRASDDALFRHPATIGRRLSLSGSSSDMISTLNLMSMRSPDEPCSSRRDEHLASTSASVAQASSSSSSQTIKEEPQSPAVHQTTVIRSSTDDDEVQEIEKTGKRKSTEEDEETPADPTPEAQIMNRISYPDGTFIERDKERPFNDELYGLLIDGIWKVFRKHDIDQATFVLYKMMVFFNEELTHRRDRGNLSEDGIQYVTMMREKINMQLLVHLQRKRGKDGLKVFSNLLLLGSTIARVRNALRKMFTMTSIFVPSNDLVDQLILKEEEKEESPSAFKHFHPPL
ncbi:hypothetical protein PMAYCL1PPCAC_33172 [Pristionchus mayeri]|uniref:Uncharacterized protein n=1 Tax=Pristionchus mayeri TaxID=1317129 RepID=A0AAN5DIJ3_9BILA|nr:hypothetical protein PMAYCL1PPCAC_33172 [Pristionchus mayeri]